MAYSTAAGKAFGRGNKILHSKKTDKFLRGVSKFIPKKHRASAMAKVYKGVGLARKHSKKVPGLLKMAKNAGF